MYATNRTIYSEDTEGFENIYTQNARNQQSERNISNQSQTSTGVDSTTEASRAKSTGVDYEKLCEKYLASIKEDVGIDDGTTEPIKIVLIGMPGVGKSSFINSLAAAFARDRWREYAYTGSHGMSGDPITVFTDTYEKFCKPEKYKEINLPTIIDVAGIENECDNLWKELLRIVFYGRLPEGVSLFEAYQYGIDHGVQGLREKFEENPENLKVDRVIFVCSATDKIPTNLIKCMLEAARPSGTDKNKRAIPVFGVTTKYDKVGDGKEISQKDFEQYEEELINALGLGGATHRYVRISNYCDDVDREQKRLESTIPAIDATLLRFMTQVCDPAIKVINKDHSFTTTTELKQENETQLRRRNNTTKKVKANPMTATLQNSNKSWSFKTFIMAFFGVFLVLWIIYRFVTLFV